MSREVVATSEAPDAVGAYSQAIVSGDLVFCSGQVALDPAGGHLVEGSIADETRRCLDNLGAVLKGAAATFDDVVKVTAYLTDMDTFQEFNGAYGEYFGDAPPARVTVGVAALPKGARVEVECIARLA